MSDTTYVKGIRLDSLTLARVERHRQWMQDRIGVALGVTEGAALRDLILRGLASVEGEQGVAPAGEGSVDDLGYDTEKYVLGKLCRNRHEWQKTGQSLLHKHNRTCVECHRVARRKKG
jgi:hypothetical protein